MTHDNGESLRPDRVLIQTMLDTIIPAGAVFEIRMLKGRRLTPRGLVDDPFVKAHSGYYTDRALAAAHVARYTGQQFAGAYVTLHQLPPHALAWGAHHIAKREKATADKDVTAYRYLYLDLDPVRPALTNATGEERLRAYTRATQVRAYLHDLGWECPVWAGGSGSGAVILYRIALPANAEAQALYRRVLVALDGLFSDDVVRLDTSVHNPGRVCRLAGTVNAKSITPQADRPWTLALGQPMLNASIVSRTQLVAVAAPERDPLTQPTRERRQPYDLARILADSGIPFREKPRDYGTVYAIADCLTSPDHRGGACFVQFASGAVAYRCLHDSCSGKGWQDVRGGLKVPERLAASTSTPRTQAGMDAYEIRGGKVVRL